MSLSNSTTITTLVEPWFIPMDIFMIICTGLTIILSIIFLSVIILDKTCHSIPVMLVGNTCISGIVIGSVMLSIRIFTLENDLKQIVYEDRLCAFRATADYVACALYYYSFVLQAVYRYVTVVYPTHLFWQSVRAQILLIGLVWAFSLLYPLGYIFNTPLPYNVDNQICQFRLQLGFGVIYACTCLFTTPVMMIMLIYYKLVRYVRSMNQHITPANILLRAQRELRMIGRIVKLVIILIVLGLPYVIFIITAFFTAPPKYHFRIAFLFVDASSALVLIVTCQFTDPLKESIMKRIKRRWNMVIPSIT